MKRMTVSLPDELADRVRAAAGGEGQVSAYVAAALDEYTSRGTLRELADEWLAELQPSRSELDDVAAEFDALGFAPRPLGSRRA